MNAPEVTYVKDIFEESILEIKIGTRYSSLNQNFTANLRRGNGQAVTTSSYQDFRGVGLTTALHMGTPLSDMFWLYARSRGSLLVGTNDRQSNFTVVVPGGGPGTVTNSVATSQTDIIPVGEFEVGLSWDNRQAIDPDSAGSDTLVWLKVGYVAQIWGDVGMISAGAQPFFGDGYLSLMGFTLQAGVQR